MPKKGPLQRSLEADPPVEGERPAPMDAHQALRIADLLATTPNHRCTVVRNTWGGWSINLWRTTHTNDVRLLTIHHATTEPFVHAPLTERAYGAKVGHPARPGGNSPRAGGRS